LNFANFSRSLPIVLSAQLLAFFAVGVYRGTWRHFGMMDTVVVAKGVLIGVVSAELVILYVYRFFSYSRTVFAIYGVLLLLAVTLSRASFRLIGEYISRRKTTGRRVVVYGAGDGAMLVLRELEAGEGSVRVLGFIDDDPRKVGISFHGFPVVVISKALRGSYTTAASSRSSSARSLDHNRLLELRTLCARHGVALTRLMLGLEELVVVTSESSQSRSHLRKVER
jgi:FlaA1/EpsC-like NDP-sugar epimerase